MRSRALMAAFRRLGTSWLVWLALSLPLAQAFAAWHELSHDLPGSTQSHDPHGLPAASCSLCLASAALGHAGTPCAPAALALPNVAACVDAPLELPDAPLPARAPYRSRAPPLVLR